MQTTPARAAEPPTVKAYDLVRIWRCYGMRGVRKRYEQLKPFADLITLMGSDVILLPERWYRSLAITMALITLQAQWEDVCAEDGQGWVAARLWTRDLPDLRQMCKGSGADSPPAVARKDFRMPSSLAEYLDSYEFSDVCRGLASIARDQERAEEAA